MNYSFRPNLFQKSRSVRLSGDCFELLNDQNQVTWSEHLEHVRNIREYPSGSIMDPDRGKCPLSHCIVSFSSGGSVVLKSASYTGPQTGRDQTSDFTCFVGELIHRLARAQPDALIINGSMGVVVAWIIVGILGLGLLVLGIAMFVSPLFTNDTLAEVFSPAAVCCIGGPVVGLMSLSMVRTYYPDRTTAAKRAGIQNP